MATFRHATVPRFSTGGFEFTKNEMRIPDTEVERLAKWRRIWAKLPIKWRVNIVEVVEKDELGRVRESSGIRGVGTAKLNSADPASMTQKPGSEPFGGSQEPNEAPDRIPRGPRIQTLEKSVSSGAPAPGTPIVPLPDNTIVDPQNPNVGAKSTTPAMPLPTHPAGVGASPVSPVSTPANPFDHDGDGKAGGSKPLPKAGEAGFIKVPPLKL